MRINVYDLIHVKALLGTDYISHEKYFFLFSRELLKVLEKAQVEKPSSEMLTRCEQQVRQHN